MEYYGKNKLDIVFRNLSKEKLSTSQYKILFCIFSFILKSSDNKAVIKASDFQETTELSLQTIVDGIKHLLDERIIYRERTENKKSFLYSFFLQEKCENKKTNEVKKGKKVKTTKEKNGYKKWDELKTNNKSLRFFSLPIEEWNFDDFGYFVTDVIKNNLKNNSIDLTNIIFILGRGYIRNRNFSAIRSYLNESTNNNFSNLLMKAYFEWFIKYKSVSIIENQSKLSSGYFVSKIDMDAFLKAHDLLAKNLKSVSDVESKLQSYKTIYRKEPTAIISQKVTPDLLRDVYKLGMASLLSEYGIILTGNYLINNEKRNFQDVVKEIHLFLKDINLDHIRQKDALKRIINKTCDYSPYYKDMKFLNWNELFRDIFVSMNGDFDISAFKITASKDKDNYPFLLENQEKSK